MVNKGVKNKTPNSKRFSPNSKRRENFSPKNDEIFSLPEFGVTSKCKSIYIRTFGCQMEIPLHADFTCFEGYI